MIYLIAILAAFLGGLLGCAMAFRSAHHRILAFLVPVFVCTALMHLPLLIEILHARFPPLHWEVLRAWNTAQGVIVLAAVLATSIGWLCSFCIQRVFED